MNIASRWSRSAAVAGIHAAVALVLTWPLALHVGDQIAVGVEPTPTVPFFNLWTLEWNANRFAHGLGNYWSAPIFAPLHDMFARSEAEPLTGALFGVYRSMVGNAAAYNLVLLTFLTLNGVTGYLLARRLGAVFVPALLAGVLAQSLPFVWNQVGVLQLVAIFPLLAACERVLAYRQQPRLTTAAAIAVWFAVAEYTCGYYAIFLAIVLLIALPLMVWRAAGWTTLLRHGAVTIALAALLVAPLAVMQQHRTSGLRWSISTVSQLSARPTAWLHHNEGNVAVPWSPIADSNEDALFPGGYALGLATCGAIVAWRTRRRIVAALLGVAAMGAALSGGLRWRVGSWRPYSVLYDHVPGFDRLRSPFRFALVSQVALVALAALAVAWLWTWRPNAGRVLAFGLVLLSVLETVPLGARLAAVPDVAHTDWVQWLDARPGGNVAMIPFPPSGSADDYVDTTVGMLASLEHGHPLVNGYTGLFPDDYVANLFPAMQFFPDELSVQLLGIHHTRYLVIRHDWLNPNRRERLRSFSYRAVFRGSDRDIYAPS